MTEQAQVPCPHCAQLGCTLCDDTLIVPVGLAVEYALAELDRVLDRHPEYLTDSRRNREMLWAKECLKLRERHGLPPSSDQGSHD